jgi:glycosyltransferase involved in cell wall biosynthesis
VVGDVIKGQEKLKRYIKDWKIRKRIHILGSLDKNYLFMLYQGALITLIPSLVESFNMVALESLAAGTPIIISSMAGVAEYLPKNSRCVSICDSLTSFLESLEKHLKGEIRINKSSCISIVRNFNVKITVLRLLKVLLRHYTF